MTPPLPAPSWRSQAACRGADTGIWFPESPGVETATGALAICATCKVIDSCRAYAVDNAAEVGIWGGLTERQRRSQRVGRQRVGKST